MTVNVSVRLDDRLATWLRVHAQAAGESLSDRLRRYAEEGARRDMHPDIVFRDGPSGRRAGVLGGPDVWEIILWADGDGGDAVGGPSVGAELIDDGVVTAAQLAAARAYQRDYSDEIAARIELHRLQTSAAASR